MRAFGPASVSSFLKTGLDVVVYALALALGAGALGLVLSVLAQPLLGPPGAASHFGAAEPVLRRSPALQMLLAGIEVWLGALLLVADRLRRVFATLIEGRPFRPQNADRLRAIGLGLIVLQLAGYALPMLLAQVATDRRAHADIDLSAWFAVLVVFVLAEVFREGARLQTEAELTV